MLEIVKVQKFLDPVGNNWFSSVPLCIALTKNSYMVKSVFRNDQTKQCSLLAEKDQKKVERGSHTYCTDANI